MLWYNSRPRNLTRSDILAVVMTDWTSSDCYTCLNCLDSKAAKIDMKTFHGDIPHFVWLVRQVSCSECWCWKPCCDKKGDGAYKGEVGGVTVCSGCFGAALQQDPASCRVGGTSLEQEGVARVAHPHRFGRGGQRQLIVGAAVTENLPAVATVVLWREAETR